MSKRTRLLLLAERFNVFVAVVTVLAFAYLWNTSIHGGYGFVGKDVNSSTNRVESFYEEHQRRTYWFRVKRGKYALTLEGFRRLAELQAQLS